MSGGRCNRGCVRGHGLLRGSRRGGVKFDGRFVAEPSVHSLADTIDVDGLGIEIDHRVVDEQTVQLHALSVRQAGQHLLTVDQVRRLTEELEQIGEGARLIPDVKQQRSRGESRDQHEAVGGSLPGIDDLGGSASARQHKHHLTIRESQVEMTFQVGHIPGLGMLHDPDRSDAVCRFTARSLNQRLEGDRALRRLKHHRSLHRSNDRNR